MPELTIAQRIREKALQRIKEIQDEQRKTALGRQLSGTDIQHSAGPVTESVAGVGAVEQGKTVDERVSQASVQTDLQPTTLVVVERPGTDGSLEEKDKDSQRGNTNLDVSNPSHSAFLQRLAELEATLLTRDPLMKTHLKAIHTAMIAEEEIVNLLTTAEIAKIMAAQQVFTNTVLARDVAKASKAKNSSKAAQISLDDV